MEEKVEIVASRVKDARWKTPLKIAVTLVAIALLVPRIPFSDVVESLRSVKPGYLAISFLCFSCGAGFQALRWRQLIGRPEIPLHKYLYFVFATYLYNLLLPSAFLADALRVSLFGRKYGQLQENAAVAIFSRLMGFVVAGVVSLIGLVLMLPELEQAGFFARLRLAPSLMLVAPAALILLAGALYALKRLRNHRMFIWFRYLVEIVHNPRTMLITLFLTIAIQLASNLAAYFVFAAVTETVPVGQVLFFVNLTQLILVLPVSFGGIGVRDYLNVLLFSEIGGMPTEIVLSAGFLGYVVTLVLAGMGGAWIVFRNLQTQITRRDANHG